MSKTLIGDTILEMGKKKVIQNFIDNWRPYIIVKAAIDSSTVEAGKLKALTSTLDQVKSLNRSKQDSSGVGPTLEERLSICEQWYKNIEPLLEKRDHVLNILDVLLKLDEVFSSQKDEIECKAVSILESDYATRFLSPIDTALTNKENSHDWEPIEKVTQTLKNGLQELLQNVRLKGQIQPWLEKLVDVYRDDRCSMKDCMEGYQYLSKNVEGKNAEIFNTTKTESLSLLVKAFQEKTEKVSLSELYKHQTTLPNDLQPTWQAKFTEKLTVESTSIRRDLTAPNSTKERDDLVKRITDCLNSYLPIAYANQDEQKAAETKFLDYAMTLLDKAVDEKLREETPIRFNDAPAIIDNEIFSPIFTVTRKTLVQEKITAVETKMVKAVVNYYLNAFPPTNVNEYQRTMDSIDKMKKDSFYTSHIKNQQVGKEVNLV